MTRWLLGGLALVAMLVLAGPSATADDSAQRPRRDRLENRADRRENRFDRREDRRDRARRRRPARSARRLSAIAVRIAATGARTTGIGGGDAQSGSAYATYASPDFVPILPPPAAITTYCLPLTA